MQFPVPESPHRLTRVEIKQLQQIMTEGIFRLKFHGHLGERNSGS